MATRCVQKTRRDCHRSATSTSTCWDATRSPYLNRSLGASSGRSETPLTAVANRTFRSIAPQTPDPGQAGGQDADREAAQGRGRSVDAVTPHAFITKVAGLSCSIEHGRYPWIPPEIGRPDGRNHTGEGSGGYSGGSGTRNPEEVEHRFRRKWNSESGKWNTESGGSGTSIPEEVEQRFRRS